MKKTARGFTLLEVLVALAVVAVIAVLSWRGLTEVTRSAERVNAVDAEQALLTATFNQLERDLAMLQLGLETAPGQQADVLLVDGQSLRISGTRRLPEQPPYREAVVWQLSTDGLIRVVQRLDTGTQGNPVPATRSEPLRFQGWQVRFFREGTGWQTVLSQGPIKLASDFKLELEGTAMTALSARFAQATPVSGKTGADSGQDGTPATGADGGQTTPAGVIRAVELALTHPRFGTVRRVLLTGGVY